jgi:hypothetical protein
MRNRVVAIVGPDGAGKSQTAAALAASMRESTGQATSVVNFRAHVVDRALGRQRHLEAAEQNFAEPAAMQQYAPLRAGAKLIAIWADLALSMVAWRFGRAQAITFVERYAYDLVLDPRRLGLSQLPAWTRWWAARLTPAPDAIIVCRAPAALVAGRTSEITERDVDEQYGRWQDVRRRLVRAPVLDVDTSRPLPPELAAALRRHLT